LLHKKGGKTKMTNYATTCPDCGKQGERQGDPAIVHKTVLCDDCATPERLTNKLLNSVDSEFN
jgi:hypothetical protein